MEDLIYHRINTIAELKALPRTARTVELDIFLVKNGIAVLHQKDHDMEPEEIERLTIGQLRTKTRTMIPELGAYITQAYQKKINLFIEIKASNPERAGACGIRVIERLVQLKDSRVFQQRPEYLQQSIVFHSFSIDALVDVQHAMSYYGLTIPIGLGWSSSAQYADSSPLSATQIDAVQKELQLKNRSEVYALPNSVYQHYGILVSQTARFEIIAFNKEMLSQELVADAHQHSLRVYSYVATNQEEIDYLRGLGVARIIFEARTIQK